MQDKYDWRQWHSYRVFDEFLQKFVLDKKSYITKHDHTLDLEVIFGDIKHRFRDGYDDSEQTFEQKLTRQFNDASEDSKIVFSNIEYLWSMPVENLKSSTKLGYISRWHYEKLVNNSERFFFNYPHIIANPGQWYLQNKYWELVALFRILDMTVSNPKVTDLSSAKNEIARHAYEAIYDGATLQGSYVIKNKCGVHSVLLHLCDPDKYESIISDNHKDRIVNVFDSVISDSELDCREEKIRTIRDRLLHRYSSGEDLSQAQRWFFYLGSVESLWKSKTTKYQQIDSSIELEISRELESVDLDDEEGRVDKAGTKYYIKRSSKLVLMRKKKDGFTCKACGFKYKKSIVHVHHLNPLSEREKPEKTNLNDLITLCPNCHSLAHYLLKDNDRYKNKEILLSKLKTLIN